MNERIEIMDFSKVVVFELNQQLFGISIHQVRSIKSLFSEKIEKIQEEIPVLN